MAVAPDGTWLACVDGSSVWIWDLPGGALRHRIRVFRELHNVVVGPDSDWVAAAGDEGAVHIWDAASGNERLSFRAAEVSERITGIAVGPDGTWLATADTVGQLGVWDPGAGRRSAWAHGTGWLPAVAVTSNGRRLAAADANRGIEWSTRARSSRPRRHSSSTVRTSP
jgi:WD40 repeat protein